MRIDTVHPGESCAYIYTHYCPKDGKGLILSPYTSFAQSLSYEPCEMTRTKLRCLCGSDLCNGPKMITQKLRDQKTGGGVFKRKHMQCVRKSGADFEELSKNTSAEKGQDENVPDSNDSHNETAAAEVHEANPDLWHENDNFLDKGGGSFRGRLVPQQGLSGGMILVIVFVACLVVAAIVILIVIVIISRDRTKKSSKSSKRSDGSKGAKQ
ncbi:hypothetical protein GCK32_014767 [Trichostrongylus colubriformis]|uniref:Uncharacterized protein n=1 Tax=Trichostrongylus colubriformis TaxID=6319 RepID=A0AAN8IFX0_TRICO